MWIFFNDAFISVVAARGKPDHVMVRARVRGDLERLFVGAGDRVEHTPEADYSWRLVAARTEVAQLLSDEIMERVDYDNFKNSVAENDRHDAYLRTWMAMRDLQRSRVVAEETKRRKRRRGKRRKKVKTDYLAPLVEDVESSWLYADAHPYKGGYR